MEIQEGQPSRDDLLVKEGPADALSQEAAEPGLTGGQAVQAVNGDLGNELLLGAYFLQSSARACIPAREKLALSRFPHHQVLQAPCQDQRVVHDDSLQV